MISNLEYYKVFYFAACCGSLTQAALKLSVSQPAVSQSLRQLEEALDTKLFVRSCRGIRLTQEGEELFSHVKKSYEEIELGEKKLLEIKNLERGELRIGASDMTLRFYLLPSGKVSRDLSAYQGQGDQCAHTGDIKAPLGGEDRLRGSERTLSGEWRVFGAEGEGDSGLFCGGE